MILRERFCFCALLLFVPSAYCLAHFSAVPTAVAGALARPLHMQFVDSSTFVGPKFAPKRFEEYDRDRPFRKLLGQVGSKAGSFRCALSIDFDASTQHYVVFRTAQALRHQGQSYAAGTQEMHSAL